MRGHSANAQELELKLTGSSTFGRYPKISSAKTYNMIISDGWLVPYSGYKKIVEITSAGKGRCCFLSSALEKLIVVIYNTVYLVDTNYNFVKLGTLETTAGDVFVDENNNSEIAICDKKDIWIYNYEYSTFQKAELDFIPGYVCFQDGYFIATVSEAHQWRLSGLNDGLTWTYDTQHVGGFQSKPDVTMACVRIPGKGSNLLIFGQKVTELWVDVGNTLFPYKRTGAFNIDYGCLSPATIASSDTFVAWIGTNEKSGPALMVSDGGTIKQITKDGINFKLSQLSYPEKSCGFLFKQDGHLLYQVSFYKDNFSFVYDFTTDMLFNLTDPDMNYHPVRSLVFFNKSYVFVSLNDGCLYSLDPSYTDCDGQEIPRIRICESIRFPDSSFFSVPRLTFTLEQGMIDFPSQQQDMYSILLEDGSPLLQEDGFPLNLELDTMNQTFVLENPEMPRIDLSMSKDGGESFGNSLGKNLNKKTYRRNRFSYYQLGWGNDFIPQFRFWGFGRFVISDGTVSVQQ